MSQLTDEEKRKIQEDLIKAKLAKLEALEKEIALREALPHRYAMKFFPWQREWFDCREKVQCLTAANQALHVDTEIPMASGGYKRMGDLVKWDKIFDINGEACYVTDIPFDGIEESYRIVFDDGTSIVAGDSHIWVARSGRDRFQKKGPKDWSEYTTRQMFEIGKYDSHLHTPAHRFCIPYVKPVEYEDVNLPINPYTLGILIGDGSLHSSMNVTKNDEEVLQHLLNEYPESAVFVSRTDKKASYVRFRKSHLQMHLEELGLMGTYSWNKFIPDLYKYSSAHDRLELLRGLMDTDGWCNADGDATEFNTASQRLADDVCELVFSLGGTVKCSIKKSHYVKNGERFTARDSYRLRIKMSPQMNPFKLKRKANLWRGDIRYMHVRVIRQIVPIGKTHNRCITVSSPTSTFVATKNYVVSHNCGKSATMMRKCIEWATNKDLWPELWPSLHKQKIPPRAFWYLYPTREMASSEFNDKWRPMLPYANHPEFGWTYFKNDKASPMLVFNSGVTVHFKTYSQGAELLQAGSCATIFCDEELPEELVSELQSRVAATDGYLIFGFTATIGQAFWKSVVEERTIWPSAWVRQVSLYDCIKYDDGTPTMWTKERIQARIDQCTTKAEVQRRVFGRFVKDEGLQYPQFEREMHVAPYHRIPRDWEVYSGVDYGSGGEKGHPASIVFVAVDPKYTQARVIRCWKGDKISTTAEDIIDVWEEIRKTIPQDITATYYDYAAADLGMIASRRGLPWQKADKSRESGKTVIAALLKAKAFKIYEPSAESEREGLPDNYLEAHKLAFEFENMPVNMDKRAPTYKGFDDMLDSCRYALIKIPFNIRSGQNGYALVVADEDPKFYAAHEARKNPEVLKIWKSDDLLANGEGEFEFWNSMLDP